MALKKCKECGKKVRRTADLCPHCGAKQKNNGIGWVETLLLFILIGFVGSQFSQCEKKAEEKKNIARQEEVRTQVITKREEKKAFEESIESHYAKLVKFAKLEQLDNALTELDLFTRFGEGNYKEVNKYYRTVKTKILSAKVKTIPASDIDTNIKIYCKLIFLNPTNQAYKNKIKYYQKKSVQAMIEKREEGNSVPINSSIGTPDYENDLTARCEDWIFYRNRAFKLGKEGDQKGSEKARRAMLQFDHDLSLRFSDEQISHEISRLEAAGYKAGF